MATPLKQFQDLINYGALKGASQGSNVGVGDAIDEGFAAGEKRFLDQQDRDRQEAERQRIANEREQKVFDEVYGELYVPPTGQKSYDAGVELMGREWKAEFAGLKAGKNAGDISIEEYIAGKHEILNRAKELKAGQAALGEGFEMYQKGVEENQISDSTPAKVKLFYQALEDGNATIENIDGRPTVVGQTEDGEDIQIDMGALASGQAPLRFNQKVDVAGMTDTIAKGLEAYKSTVKGPDGFSLANAGWDQIKERASHDVDQLLTNRSTLEAIAADEVKQVDDGLGQSILLNNASIKDMSDEELRDIVQPYVLEKVQREYYPTSQLDKYTGLTAYQRGNLANQRSKAAQKPSKGQGRQRLVSNLQAKLQAHVGGEGGLNEQLVESFQDQIGDNIVSIEFDSNAFTPWKNKEVVIRTKDGNKIVADSPEALVGQIATAKFGDEAIADTANQITTSVTKPSLSKKQSRSKYNY